MLKKFLPSLLAAVFGGYGIQASAGTGTLLSGTVTVDDAFELYLSTDDSVAGDLLASASDWTVPVSFSAALVPGQTYYLHVKGWDVWGSISAFLGQFALSKPEFVFENGTQALVTDTTHWRASVAGFGTGYFPPYSYGKNGVGPWGSFASISTDAEWIWSPREATGAPSLGTVYFSTRIDPVPEPETYALFLAGLGLLGVAARRRSI